MHKMGWIGHSYPKQVGVDLGCNMISLCTQCMNGFDEIGIAREGLQGDRLIPPEEMGNVVLLHIQIGELEPRQRVFEVAPDPLNRVQLGAVGGQEHEAHVSREQEPLSGMRPTIVEEQEIQAVRESRREGGNEDLEAFRVQIRQFQEEPLTGRGRHGAIDIAPLEDVLDRSHRLHAIRREAPPADRQQAEATFVLAEYPDGAGVRGGDCPLELCVTGRLERRNGLRLFLCDWGVAL
jgi:hypothetical protein